MKCRNCNNELNHTFIDLGSSPPSNSYLTKEGLRVPEKYYPLKVKVCNQCWLTQTEDFVGTEEMFSKDYAYFSSYSLSWLEHARQYVEKMKLRLNLTEKSMVVEVAANDGYLLQFVQEVSIPCYGIEPTHSTAKIARERGIDIIEDFFGEISAKKLASQRRQVDLAIANNVLAHVPDINDFIKGFLYLLKPTGVATFEFPHLLSLVQHNQFDTIYHEHYSYISLMAIQPIFEKNGLTIIDVEELSTHGGSLRVFVQRSDTGKHGINKAVQKLKEKEIKAGMNKIIFYQGFQRKAEKVKNDFLNFLIKNKMEGKNIAAYGAAAKGNTILNYAGVKPDLLPFIADGAPSKQGMFTPGGHIPIVNKDYLYNEKPDYILVLPWNLSEEIISQNSEAREWGCKFVTAIPEIQIF